MVFFQNRNFLSAVFSGQIKPKQSFLDILDIKETFFRLEKWSFKKVQKIEIFPMG